MRRLASVAVLLIVPAGNAQEKPAHPGYPPMLLLASASEEEGKVVIQLSRSGPVPPPEDGKVRPGDRLATEWVPLRKVTLGDTVQAFRIDGKPAEPTAVLKALAKPKGVAVFLRSHANDPVTPPSFYRDLFREGTLLLVAKAEDLYYSKP
jgi:hypothetical protein